jgi:uncharacterized protein YuzE
MKITYDAGVNAAYIYLSAARIEETEETNYGLIVDLDSDRRIVGIEILEARDFFSARALEQFERIG